MSQSEPEKSSSLPPNQEANLRAYLAALQAHREMLVEKTDRLLTLVSAARDIAPMGWLANSFSRTRFAEKWDSHAKHVRDLKNNLDVVFNKTKPAAQAKIDGEVSFELSLIHGNIRGLGYEISDTIEQSRPRGSDQYVNMIDTIEKITADIKQPFHQFPKEIFKDPDYIGTPEGLQKRENKSLRLGGAGLALLGLATIFMTYNAKPRTEPPHVPGTAISMPFNEGARKTGGYALGTVMTLIGGGVFALSRRKKDGDTPAPGTEP